MRLRDFWRRDRGESERSRFPLDPLSRDSWHDEAEARYGEQPYRNYGAFDDEHRRFNDRWENSYSGPGYARFSDRDTRYGGASDNPFYGDHPLLRAGSSYDSDYFGGNGIPRTRWQRDDEPRDYDDLVYGGAPESERSRWQSQSRPAYESNRPRSNQATGRFSGVGPRGYRRSDERIKEDVCQCLTDDRHIDATNIDVAVTDREVVLSGTVSSRAEKRHAEDLSERIAGVRDVINSLRVVDNVTTLR